MCTDQLRNIDGTEREFTVEEVLAQCDPTAPAPETTGWETRAPKGDEIL